MGADKYSLLLDVYLLKRESLKHFLTARLGSAGEAEDLIQELYFRLDRAAAAWDTQRPMAYLYKIAHNLARDHMRGRQRAQERDGHWAEATRTMAGSDPIANQPPADLAYEHKEYLAKIIAALEDLSPQCRRVFILHKIEELSHLEIASRLGISRHTVEKHMGTALRHLLKQLGRR